MYNLSNNMYIIQFFKDFPNIITLISVQGFTIRYIEDYIFVHNAVSVKVMSQRVPSPFAFSTSPNRARVFIIFRVSSRHFSYSYSLNSR